MVQFGERPIQQNPLEYSGQRDALIPTFDAPRAPTVLDRKYPIQSIWRDNTTNDEWILVDIINGNALWVLLTGGGFGTVTSLRADDGNVAFPNIGIIDIDCNTVAAGTNPTPFYSTAAVANTVDLDVQISTAAAASDAGNVGLCSFDSAMFTVDGNGFVQLAGGGLAVDQINVDANTAPGTDPVLPDAAGQITIAGAVVAAHVIPVETHSRAVNAFNIEIQVSSDITGAPANMNDAGVCSFNDTQFVVDANGYVSLIGGGQAIDSLTGDVGLAVPPDVAGNINLIGTVAQAFIQTTGTPASNQIEIKIIEPNGDGELLIGNTAAAAPLVGDITTSTILRQYNNPDLILDQVSFYQEGHSNFGMTYSGGTFTLHASDGNNLSATNRGFIRIRSKATLNIFRTFIVTSNYTFDDAASVSSDIAGNLFGTTTGVAWGDPMPFFIYAVINDAEDAITFMISRLMTYKASCSSANMGKPSAATADAQHSMWALDDSLTLTDWDSNPCTMIGSFRMTKSAGDDWTVSAFTTGDGIGLFNYARGFVYPPGHNGAVAGSYFSQEGGGGTMPTWASEATHYVIAPTGFVHFTWNATTCNGAGVGAGNLLIHPPFHDALGNYYNPPGSLSFQDASVANARKQFYPYNAATAADYFRFYDFNPAGAATLTPADIAVGDSQACFSVVYRVMAN